MGKNKLRKFAENRTFEHLFQPTLEEALTGQFPMRGQWREAFFNNDRPITLELGCGKGEYTVDLARRFPQRNFIGMDVKGARLWTGAKAVLQEGLTNVAFVRGRIESIGGYFGKDEIDEIWITFPDPQLKVRRTKKRLTGLSFLACYARFLRTGGVIHLKTDSIELFEYTRGVVAGMGADEIVAMKDVDKQIDRFPELAIRTHYEKLFRDQGKSITYLSFRLPPDWPNKRQLK